MVSSGRSAIDCWNQQAARENPECTIGVRSSDDATGRWPTSIPPESRNVAHKIFHPRPLSKMIGQITKIHSDLSAEFYYAITWEDYLPLAGRKLELLRNVIACILRNRVELRDWHQD